MMRIGRLFAAATWFAAAVWSLGCGPLKPRFAVEHQIALLDAERAYTEQLAAGLERLAQSPDLRSVGLVLSAGTINQLLKGLEGARVEVPQISGHVTTVAAEASFRDGFPEVRLTARVETSRLPAALGVRVDATLEPRIQTDQSESLALAVRPLEIHPSIEAGGNSVGTPETLDVLLAAVLSRYLDALPTVTVPITSQLAVDLPATSHPVRLPTQSGALHGAIEVPAFSSKVTLAMTQLYFLSDGLHVVASIDPDTPRLLPFHVPSSAPVAASRYTQAVEERKQALENARQRLQPLAAPLKVTDAEIAVSIAPQALDAMFAAFNALPESGRTVRYRTNSEEGQLFKTGGGGAGCGGYVNLVGGNSASAELTIGAVKSRFADSGLTLSAQAVVSAHAQIQGHVNGAPTPTVRWVRPCNICPPRPEPGTTCDVTAGGGVGLGNIGASGRREEDIVLRLSMRSDAASWLHYGVTLESPRQIPITIEVGAGALGNIGVPLTFDVPESRLASGTAPPVFGNRGQLTLDKPVRVDKEYDLKVTPAAWTMSSQGYLVKANAALAWRPVTPPATN